MHWTLAIVEFDTLVGLGIEARTRLKEGVQGSSGGHRSSGHDELNNDRQKKVYECSADRSSSKAKAKAPRWLSVESVSRAGGG